MNDDETSIKQVTAEVAAAIDRENISVEEIQDLVERKLMMRNPSVAKNLSFIGSGVPKNVKSAHR